MAVWETDVDPEVGVNEGVGVCVGVNEGVGVGMAVLSGSSVRAEVGVGVEVLSGSSTGVDGGVGVSMMADWEEDLRRVIGRYTGSDCLAWRGDFLPSTARSRPNMRATNSMTRIFLNITISPQHLSKQQIVGLPRV